MKSIITGMLINNLTERFFQYWEKFAADYATLVWLIAIFLPFLESVLPFLPLVLIVSFNIRMLSPLLGPSLSPIIAIVLSAAGSFLGTYFVFLFIRGTFGRKLRIKIENNPKILSIIKWLENRSSFFVILVMSNPYTPASLFNYAMAITNIEIKRYLYITIISRTICIILLALLGIVFKVQNNFLSIIWVILVYVIIYLLFYAISKLRKK